MRKDPAKRPKAEEINGHVWFKKLGVTNIDNGGKEIRPIIDDSGNTSHKTEEKRKKLDSLNSTRKRSKELSELSDADRKA